MTQTGKSSRPSASKLILVPAILTLGVTLLRIAGELLHWSTTYFNPGVGGPNSIVGITWLAPVFGIYFAVRLSMRGEGPHCQWRAIVFSTLGIAVGFGSFYVGAALHVNRSFYIRLIYIWLAFALAGLVTWPGWPALFKTLVAYAYAARVPVAIIMLIAIYRNWGTHYDVAPRDMPSMGWVAKWAWIGLAPQLILWVGFTIATGMFFGSLAAGVMRLIRGPTKVSA
jgi:hypothetical protein